MNCAEVDHLLSAGMSVRELRTLPAVREHVESCGRCQDLVSWSEAPAPDPGIGRSVEERVLSFIHADLKPIRPLPSAAVAIGGLIVLAGMISVMHALTMGVAGWNALSRGQVLWFSGLTVGVLLLAAASLVASIRPGSRQRVHPLIPVLVLAAGFPVLIGWLFPIGPGERFAWDGVRCLAGGLMAAALTSGITYALARRGYATNWPRTGAVIGVLGGVVAVLALQISCPSHEFSHLLVWHGLAMFISIAGGYLAGTKIPSA